MKLQNKDVNIENKEVNMNNILKYKVFKSSEEFEEFQKENSIQVISITPIAGTANGNTTETSEEAMDLDISISFNTFVVYRDALL